MDSRGQAEKILQACAGQLKGLIEAALANGDFDSVIYVTTILKGLSDLQLDTLADPAGGYASHHEALPDEADQPSPPLSRRHAEKAKSGTKSTYPRFRRDGSNLVKVGWSKKSRQEYEHRAAFEVALTVASCLDDMTTGGRTANVEELAPSLADASGHEIPSYQLYLAIAWLRSERLLNRIGRKGYTSVTPGELTVRARERWEEMSA